MKSTTILSKYVNLPVTVGEMITNIGNPDDGCIIAHISKNLLESFPGDQII